MFTSHQEEELAEIKALVAEIGQRFQDVEEQLGRIQEAQEQRAGTGSKGRKRQAHTPAPAAVDGGDGAVDGGEAEPGETGKRKAGRPRPKAAAAAGADPGQEVVGAKKGKKARRQASMPVSGAVAAEDAEPTQTGKRKADRRKPGAIEGGEPGQKVAGAKKAKRARNRQASTPVAGAVDAGAAKPPVRKDGRPRPNAMAAEEPGQTAEEPGQKVAGGKKAKRARNRQASAPAAGEGGKRGKRKARAVTRSGTGEPQQITKRRRVTTLSSPGSAPDGEAAPRSGSDED